MAKKEFKIGEVFQCGLVKLKCCEDVIYRTERCEKCFFNYYGECADRFANIAGNCSHLNREDKTNVIFIKVEK